MDAGQRDIPWSSDSESDDDSITTWVTLPPMDSSVTVYGVHGEFYNVPPMSRVQYAGAFGAGDTLYQGRFSEDSSFALSFWIKSVGSGAGLVFAEAKKGDVGFEIKQCPADTTALCTYVYNGGDSAETVPYGKAAILDGKLHHYSMVIHKKHLTIAVDGTALRDTDLKLSDDFYKLQGVSIGAPLKSLILYSFGDFIRKDGDKDWVRLKAWLKAFYEFQLNR